GYDPSTGKSLAAYIAGISAHIVGQYFRQQKKEKFIETGLSTEIPGNPGDLLSELIDEERGKKLRECLRRLKPKYKEVLLLRFYEKRSIEEIAQQLNVDRRRVSERIHYASQLLSKECRRENYFSIFNAFLPIL
ncbi:MAG: RNA polymerase sigma factor, partial [bacterium]